jgi:hypothetical protein
MIVTEVVESSAIERAHVVISNRISKIKNYHRNFEHMIRVAGFENTVNEIEEFLTDDKLVQLVMTNLAKENYKFNILYNTYIGEATALRKKLDTGLPNE